jgi:hypothetical protein
LAAKGFEHLLRACALGSANLLSKTVLVRDVGIAPSTAHLWLSTLEASGQTVLLEPGSRTARGTGVIHSPDFRLYGMAPSNWHNFLVPVLRSTRHVIGRSGWPRLWNQEFGFEPSVCTSNSIVCNRCACKPDANFRWRATNMLR